MAETPVNPVHESHLHGNNNKMQWYAACMLHLGMTKAIELEVDGSGDSGDIKWQPSEHDDKLLAKITDWDLDTFLNDAFQEFSPIIDFNNEGCQGTITIDFTERKITAKIRHGVDVYSGEETDDEKRADDWENWGYDYPEDNEQTRSLPF